MELDFSENTEAPCDETETLVQEQSAIVPRRSERQKRPPDYYRVRVSKTTSEPKTIEEATSSPEKSKWMEAMESEMQSLKENE